MSAIAYFLEAEGISTTGISLVRENTVAFAPPRFLWVPFALGRPLGVPNDTPFQHRVIEHALLLLDRAQGPVLEDFPQDAPASDIETVLACPVSFVTATTDALDNWSGRLRAEVKELSPWYQARLAETNRTSVGILSQPPLELAQELGESLDQHTLPAVSRCKHLLEDLKAYYLEAMAAQPGAVAQSLALWLWRDTQLGIAMRELHARLQGNADPGLQRVAAALVPRWVLESEFAQTRMTPDNDPALPPRDANSE